MKCCARVLSVSVLCALALLAPVVEAVEQANGNAQGSTWLPKTGQYLAVALVAMLLVFLTTLVFMTTKYAGQQDIELTDCEKLFCALPFYGCFALMPFCCGLNFASELQNGQSGKGQKSYSCGQAGLLAFLASCALCWTGSAIATCSGMCGCDKCAAALPMTMCSGECCKSCNGNGESDCCDMTLGICQESCLCFASLWTYFSCCPTNDNAGEEGDKKVNVNWCCC